MMNRPADAEIVLRLIATADGGKERAVLTGYRPSYEIQAGFLTSVNHELLGVPELFPGAECRANVWFFTLEVYPGSLWPGKKINVSEGSRIVGTARVVHVFNPLLRDTTRAPSAQTQEPEE